ncbi:hypothetical protein [Streptomyces cyaneofuscatus]|uniref:hypothetical protein n=1 Tax=Streptomyces cyaneofuscatus TaxID=66883 RepID=UPI00365EE736
MPHTRNKNRQWTGPDPGPGGLLNWRQASHFDRWQDRSCTLCDQSTLMRSHAGEPVHKSCTER